MKNFLGFALSWVRLLPAPLVEKLVFGILDHVAASTKTDV